MARHTLQGSERPLIPGARAVGPAESQERIAVSLILRRAADHKLRARQAELARGNRPDAHMRREDFALKFGARPGDIAAVEAFAAAHGLTVVEVDRARRTVVLSGTVADFNAAFGVQQQRFEHEGGSYRGVLGQIHLPANLKGIVEAVFGLDDRPAARALD